MSAITLKIKVIGTDQCPLYATGDEFKITGKSMIAPFGKSTCIILVGDITEVLLKHETMDDESRYVFDCSGCTGIARLEYKKLIEPPSLKDGTQGGDLHAVEASIRNFPFFQNMDEQNIQEIYTRLEMKNYETGDIILQKGEPGKNLYIIVTGTVEVLAEDGIRIAVLGCGEIFGEMSLISGDPVGATVRALASLKVLYLNGKYFRGILQRSSTIQLFLTRLLARRIAMANVTRSREIATGLTGNLTDISSSELLQTLHDNQKTGVLILKLEGGLAAMSFRDGKIIRAKYRDKEDREAFLEVFRASSGRFKFHPELPPEEKREEEIEPFMKLLMDAQEMATRG